MPVNDRAQGVQTILVQTPAGPRFMAYEALDGFVVAEGDIVLGPLSMIQGKDVQVVSGDNEPSDGIRRQGAFATPELGKRWPNGVIPYEFEPGFPSRTTAMAAMDRWSEVTSLKFRPKRWYDANSIIFRRQAAELSSWSEGIGMQGGVQTLRLVGGRPMSTYLHELGHVIGLYHEHTRPDRDEHITWDTGCNRGLVGGWIDLTNSGVNMSGVEISDYDFNSIMHYPSSLGIDSEGNGCWNFTNAITGAPVNGATVLSTNDINAVWQMYGRSAGTNSTGDEFGGALLSRDFDRDGFTDLAVGAPNDANGIGRVLLYKGTDQGLTFWKALRPPTSEQGQRFGAALAAGDYDRDGTTDLAVGAPFATVSSKTQAGEVYIYSITDDDLTPTPSRVRKEGWYVTTVEAYDHFGYSLAAGRFQSNFRIDLAIGAPGARVAGQLGRPGNVLLRSVLENDAIRLVRITDVDSTTRPMGRLGFSLQTLESSTWRDGLAVGAPGYTTVCSDVPQVLVLDPAPVQGWRPRVTDSIQGSRDPGYCIIVWGELGYPVAIDTYPAGIGKGFGFALATADFDDDGKREVAIGAPEFNGTGRVRVYEDTNGQFNYVKWLRQGTVTHSAGFSLVADDFDGDGFPDLLVGSPYSDGTSPNSGEARIYRGRGGAIDSFATWTLTQGRFGNEADDHFGTSVAFLDVSGEGRMNVIVGAPGEAPGSEPRSGAIYTSPNSLGPTNMQMNVRITQESKSNHAP